MTTAICSDCTVNVTSPMLALLSREGVQYMPNWPGVNLLPETGDPANSLQNVRSLLQEGLTFNEFIAGPAGILLLFQTGEAILLTGFALGGGPRTRALAEAASEIGIDNQDALHHWYTALGRDYEGPITQ